MKPFKEKVIEGFRKKFIEQKMCKACCKFECDHSTTGCPWYQNGVILGIDNGTRYGIDKQKEIETLISSSFDLYTQEINGVIEGKRATLCDCTVPHGNFTNRCEACKKVIEDKRTGNDLVEILLSSLSEKGLLTKE